MAERFGSVRRRSVAEIEKLTKTVRHGVGVGYGDRLPMMPILEFMLEDMVEGAYMTVEFDKDMGGAEGRTDWLTPVITLSQKTYNALERSDPRARMTAAHELGHLLMHTKQEVFHYRTRARDPHVDPEWQADTFAAILLMPTEAFRKMTTVTQAMKTFGVSRSAATRRARDLKVPLIDDVGYDRTKKKGYGMHRTP